MKINYKTHRSFLIKMLFVFSIYVSNTAIAKPQEFILSTEIQIGKLAHILARAPKGAYITVGSERGFRGASMAHNIDSLILFDIADDIIRFNSINIELLKAPNKEIYKKLRWESNLSDWKKVSNKLTKEDFLWWKENVGNLKDMNYPLPEELNKYGSALHNRKFIDITEKIRAVFRTVYSSNKSLKAEESFIQKASLSKLEKIIKKYNLAVNITEEEWNWWINIGKNKDHYCSKTLLLNPEQRVDLGQVLDYKTGNYLFDEKLYQKLHRLAVDNKIITLKANLTDKNDFNRITSLLRANNRKISVLDLDNLYFEAYIGQKAYRDLVFKFLDFSTNKSILIAMSNYKDFACGQFQTYVGFTFENIRNWPTDFLLQSFFDKTMPHPMMDLIDGKFYEKKELPPMEYLRRQL